MSSRSNKLHQPGNDFSPAERRTSRRVSQSSDGTKDRPSSSVYGRGSSTRSRASSRIESSSSLRPNYIYSGLDLLNGSRHGSDESAVFVERTHSRSSLPPNYEDLPTLNFMKAGKQRNAEFHSLFPMLARDESLLEDYGCALQREVTIQGRIYITERNLCFYSSIFGWITDFAIPISTITSLERKSTAFIIPNAIQITTRNESFTLSSFLARDATYDLLYRLWCLRTHPEDNARWSVENSRETKHRSPAIAGQSFKAMVQTIDLSTSSRATDSVPEPKVTECRCGKEGKHYSEPVVDTILAAPLEQILKLLLDKEVRMNFLSNTRNVLGAFKILVQSSLPDTTIKSCIRMSNVDIKVTEWAPIAPGSPLSTRELSYIQPLHLWIGPKQTRCEQHEVMTHVDLSEYVSSVTTTSTPDVPGGHLFTVKTRTCIMWASPLSSRLVVTAQVEWTGRSFLKGLIESSAIDGVKEYLVDLVDAVRQHISHHNPNPLVGEHVDPEICKDDTAELPHTPDLRTFMANVRDSGASYPISQGQQYVEAKSLGRSPRSDLQLALDTLRESSQLVWHGVEAAIRRIYETYPNGVSAISVMWALTILLGVSNLWLLVSVSSSLRRMEERLRDIQDHLEAG